MILDPHHHDASRRHDGCESSAALFGDLLSELYETYNRREFVHPDPLEFLYGYDDVRDREIVALVASCLAYGAVRQILKSVGLVLARMGNPRAFLADSSRTSLLATFRDFKHRFTTGEELATLLHSVKLVVERHGSLGSCLASGCSKDHATVMPALTHFVGEVSSGFNGRPRSLLPRPEAGSACKRLHLFLRWMVRHDAVDPGGWEMVPASSLLVPLDVHMHRISRALGFTRRKQADLRAAEEITAAFRAVAPHDPVRFDFALTRLGIRDDLDPEAFVSECRRIARPDRS